jgi:hypothetical protein
MKKILAIWFLIVFLQQSAAAKNFTEKNLEKRKEGRRKFRGQSNDRELQRRRCRTLRRNK